LESVLTAGNTHTVGKVECVLDSEIRRPSAYGAEFGGAAGLTGERELQSRKALHWKWEQADLVLVGELHSLIQSKRDLTAVGASVAHPIFIHDARSENMYIADHHMTAVEDI